MLLSRRTLALSCCGPGHMDPAAAITRPVSDCADEEKPRGSDAEVSRAGRLPQAATAAAAIITMLQALRRGAAGGSSNSSSSIRCACRGLVRGRQHGLLSPSQPAHHEQQRPQDATSLPHLSFHQHRQRHAYRLFSSSSSSSSLPSLNPLGLRQTTNKTPVRDAAPILTDAQASIVKEEQALLEKLHKVLVSMEAPQQDLDILKDAICQVEDLFMVCVVGEFNAGKSRFINALLGDTYLKEGVTPTTAKICFVKHTDRVGVPTRYADAQGQMIDEVEEKLLDVPLLKNMALVDTPGTNAVIQRHSQ
ncbi:hypothetical protein VYU27_010359, partial [Nannochloropsis oceanica]